MSAPRYIAIANPDGLRWQAYEPELRQFWRERGHEVEVVVVPWHEVIAAHGQLDAFEAFDRPAVVRIESPGRDWDVSRRLLRLGSDIEEEDTSVDWLNLDYQRGRLVRPRLFYAGFRHVLAGLRRSLDARPHLRPTACPLQLAEMFDKNATCARLAAAGITVPRSLVAPGTTEALIDLVREQQFQPAYVKLNTGSSASAIAVLHSHTEPTAISSIVVREDAFFSTRQLQTHSGERLRRVLAFLLHEGVCIQQGIRMAQIDGLNFDVRVIVIHGRPAFTIFRLSNNPMTNLHLGGHRGDVSACRAAIPQRAWLDGLDQAIYAARQYPHCATVGVDLLFQQGYRHQFILEVNAFGDFFPNWTDEAGRSVYRVELEMAMG